MAKIKLDLDVKPEGFTFQCPVAIPTESGKAITITFDFVFRDREAFADLWNIRIEESRKLLEVARSEMQETASDEKPVPSGREMAAKAIATDVANLMDIAAGWNVESEWSEPNLRAFVKRYSGAPAAIWEKYKTALTEGRLGN